MTDTGSVQDSTQTEERRQDAPECGLLAANRRRQRPQTLVTLLRDGPKPAPRPTPAPRRAIEIRVRPAEAPRRSVVSRLGRDVCLGVVCVLILNFFVVQVSIVRGHSMAPFLDDGDRLVVDKTTGTVAAFERFDVVVMRSPERPEIDYVKRIVALPGERVALRRGLVWIDGHPIDEQFAHIADDDNMAPCVVPDGHVFVLGDNRPVSADSRSFGLVPVDLLRGKVRARVWPLSRMAIWD